MIEIYNVLTGEHDTSSPSILHRNTITRANVRVLSTPLRAGGGLTPPCFNRTKYQVTNWTE